MGIQFSVLGIVVYSAVSIYKFLYNNLSKSRRGLALQRQLYYTLLVQVRSTLSTYKLE